MLLVEHSVLYNYFVKLFLTLKLFLNGLIDRLDSVLRRIGNISAI